VGELAVRNKKWATVYELSVGFDCNCVTVAERLKKVGITMSLMSPSFDLVDEMVRL
jgi:hypothetical protein